MSFDGNISWPPTIGYFAANKLTAAPKMSAATYVFFIAVHPSSSEHFPLQLDIRPRARFGLPRGNLPARRGVQSKALMPAVEIDPCVWQSALPPDDIPEPPSEPAPNPGVHANPPPVHRILLWAVPLASVYATGAI